MNAARILENELTRLVLPAASVSELSRRFVGTPAVGAAVGPHAPLIAGHIGGVCAGGLGAGRGAVPPTPRARSVLPAYMCTIRPPSRTVIPIRAHRPCPSSQRHRRMFGLTCARSPGDELDPISGCPCTSTDRPPRVGSVEGEKPLSPAAADVLMYRGPEIPADDIYGNATWPEGPVGPHVRGPRLHVTSPATRPRRVDGLCRDRRTASANRLPSESRQRAAVNDMRSPSRLFKSEDPSSLRFSLP